MLRWGREELQSWFFSNNSTFTKCFFQLVPQQFADTRNFVYWRTKHCINNKPDISQWVSVSSCIHMIPEKALLVLLLKLFVWFELNKDVVFLCTYSTCSSTELASYKFFAYPNAPLWPLQAIVWAPIWEFSTGSHQRSRCCPLPVHPSSPGLHPAWATEECHEVRPWSILLI